MSLVLLKMPLRVATPAAWLDAVLADFDAFLRDHAACERKASALAMSFVAKYPDREALLEPMICLAKEELAHFHEVYRIIHRKGLDLVSDEKDPYVAALLKNVRHGREEHFLDRLLIAAMIEARSCERFTILGEALGDTEIGNFYRRLAREEAGHYMVFVRIARQYFSEQAVAERSDTLLDAEAQAMLSVTFRAAVH